MPSEYERTGVASTASSSPTFGRIFLAIHGQFRPLSAPPRRRCSAIWVNTLESVGLDGTLPLKPQADLNMALFISVQCSEVT